MNKETIKMQGTGKDVFNLLVVYSPHIANYFGVDEEYLTFDQVLEYFDTFQKNEFGLIES